MVGVIVRQQNVGYVNQADGGAKQLPLGTFAAVNQKAIAATTNENRRCTTPRGRYRARRADKNDIELHEAILRSGLGQRAGRSRISPATIERVPSSLSRRICQIALRGSPL